MAVILFLLIVATSVLFFRIIGRRSTMISPKGELVMSRAAYSDESLPLCTCILILLSTCSP